MTLHYWDKEEHTEENYPNIISCMMITYNEFMITFMDGLGCISTRRLIINETHYFSVEIE